MEALKSDEITIVKNVKNDKNDKIIINVTNNISIKENTSVIINEITFQEIIDRLHN